MITKYMLNQEKKQYGLKPRSIIGVAGHVAKSILIDSLLKYNTYKSCLMIDGGQGGDISKYINIGVNKIILTDPFEDQLSRVNVKMKSLKLLKVYVTHPEFVNIVKSMSPRIDIVDWQFAIHYAWKRTSKETISNLLSSILETNGILVISCFDGNKLRMNILDDELSFKISDDVSFKFYHHTSETYKFIASRASSSASSTEYDEAHIENYVYIDELIESITNHGFELKYSNSFFNILSDAIDKNTSINTPNTSTSIFIHSVEELKKSEYFDVAMEYYKYVVGLVFVRT